MTIFDEALTILGLQQSVQALAEELGEADQEVVQVGVVLSLPIVVVGLDEWLIDDTRRDRLSARLGELHPGSDVTDYPTLADRYDVGTVGQELLLALFTEHVGRVAHTVARRANLPAPSTARILQVAATAVQVCLAQEYGPDVDPDDLIEGLFRARTQLHGAGWDRWIAQTVGATTGMNQPVERAAAATPPGQDAPAPGVGPDTIATGVGAGAVTGAGAVHRSAVGDEATMVEGAVPTQADGTERGATANPRRRTDHGVAGVAPADRGRDGRATIDGRHPSSRNARPAERPVRSEPDWEPRRSKLPFILLAGVGLALAAALIFRLARDDGTGDSSELGSEEPATPVTEATESEDQAPPADTEVTEPEAEPTAPAGSGAPAFQEVSVDLVDPLGRSDASGTASIQFDAAQGQVCFIFDSVGLSERYDGHIHVGPAGVKGGIVVDFRELVGPVDDCLGVSAVDIDAILNDPAGHYVEFHDETEEFTIRAQLGDPVDSESVGTDDDDAGAFVVIGQNSLILRGEVPDEVAREKLLETFSDISLDGVEIVDELTVVPGSPRPSGRIVVDNAILFDVDSDQLADVDNATITDLAAIFNSRPAWRMTIIGNTDDVGPEVYNLELSLRRAEAVRRALIDLGVDSEVMTVEGAGATDPIAPNDTPEGRSQNRRIEFRIIGG